jgi:hypothetical protein
MRRKDTPDDVIPDGAKRSSGIFEKRLEFEKEKNKFG